MPKIYIEDFPIEEVRFDPVFALVKEEEIKQRKRWGPQGLSLPEWITILAEEHGELAKAVMEKEYDRGGSNDDIIKEAYQVAMIACKIARIAMIDKGVEPYQSRASRASSDEGCSTQ